MEDRRTIATLNKLFWERYTDNQIVNSIGLIALCGYLTVMMRRIEGKYTYEPPKDIAPLIVIYLNKNDNRFKSITEPLPEPTITYKKCMDCFYLETCEYIEKGLTEYIEKCSIVKKSSIFILK